MHIDNPRRILAVSLEGHAEQLRGVIRDLTGHSPQPSSSLVAGSTQMLSLQTSYYTALVPVWLDLISSPSEWAASFLSEEAAEVLAVLGGVVLVFSAPAADEATRQVIRHVGEVVARGLGGWEWDGVRLAVGVGAADDEDDDWIEACAEAGFEYVGVGAKRSGLNEFGEKTGLARVREALESNDWAQAISDLSQDDEFGDFEETTTDLGIDAEDLDHLKAAIWTPSSEDDAARARSADGNDTAQGPDEQQQVTQLEGMMRRLQAVRDAGDGLPEAQRKRMAARAVHEVMKELE